MKALKAFLWILMWGVILAIAFIMEELFRAHLLPTWSVIVVFYILGIVLTYFKIVGAFYGVEKQSRKMSGNSWEFKEYFYASLTVSLMVILLSWAGFFIVLLAQFQIYMTEDLPWVWFKINFKDL